MNLWEKYKDYLRQGKWRIKPFPWIVISIIFSLSITGLTYAFIEIFSLPVSQLITGIIFLVSIDLLIGYPYLKAIQRIDAIEHSLSDAWKQMADTLRAGGTYEFALREITTSEYGPLTEEMEGVLRKLEEGENLENSLKSFSNNIDSTPIKRSITIILDSIEAGAGLADVLDEIADDLRSTYRIKKERKTTTMMQVLFMIAAGTFVAPFIFGMVSTIIEFLIITASKGLSLASEQVIDAINAKNLITLLMELYIIIEVIASGAMIAMMREGRLSKSIIYIPVLLLIAYIVYYVSAFLAKGIIAG